MDDRQLLLFALDGSRELGEAMAASLGLVLAPHEERSFEDSEHKSRPLVSVRGRDVYVIHSLYDDAAASVNDKLLRLLFFVGALKDAAAASVTAVVPYLAYSRKDRKSKPRDPVTTRYVAAMFEALRTDCVVTLDVHNLAAFQNAFRCRTEHLEATALFVRHVAKRVGDAPLVVVSPDAGGIKRADAFRRRFAQATGTEPTAAFVEKYRSEATVTGGTFVGDAKGRVAIVIDDLVSGGTTIDRAARACREHGAVAVHAAATHGVFAPEANARLAESPIDEIVVTDSVAPWRLTEPSVRAKLVQLSIAPLFAETIRRLHEGGSIVELLQR